MRSWTSHLREKMLCGKMIFTTYLFSQIRLEYSRQMCSIVCYLILGEIVVEIFNLMIRNTDCCSSGDHADTSGHHVAYVCDCVAACFPTLTRIVHVISQYCSR